MQIIWHDFYHHLFLFSKVSHLWQWAIICISQRSGATFCFYVLYLPRKNTFSFLFKYNSDFLWEKLSLSTLSKLSNAAVKDIKCCLVFLVHSHSVIRHPLNAYHVLVTLNNHTSTRPCLLPWNLSVLWATVRWGYFPVWNPWVEDISSWTG